MRFHISPTVVPATVPAVTFDGTGSGVRDRRGAERRLRLVELDLVQVVAVVSGHRGAHEVDRRDHEGTELHVRLDLPVGLAAARGVWLTLHLLSVIPALPLGAYILLLRKGDRPHKLLGRVWAFMMMTAALSSFGLHGMTGHLSWIHILSIVTIVSIPRAVIQVIRGNVAGHRRTMTLVYVGLIIAGAATFIPGRLFAGWLFG